MSIQYDDPFAWNRNKRTSPPPQDYTIQRPPTSPQPPGLIGQSNTAAPRANTQQTTSVPTMPTTPRPQTSGAPFQQTQPMNAGQTNLQRRASLSASTPQAATPQSFNNTRPVPNGQYVTMPAGAPPTQVQPMPTPTQLPMQSQQIQQQQARQQQQQMMQMNQGQPMNQAAAVPVNLQKRSWLPSANNEMEQMQAISDQLAALRAMRNGAGQFQYNGQMMRKPPLYQGNWQ